MKPIRSSLTVGVVALLFALGSALTVSPGSANPLGAEEPWVCGRIMPARDVPVDIVSERLQAEMIPVEEPFRSFAVEGLRTADVKVDYVLRADDAMRLPIIFPIVNSASDLRFELNGEVLELRVASDVDVFAAYEPEWRRAIDEFIATDTRLTELAEYAERLMTQLREDYRQRIERMTKRGQSTRDIRIKPMYLARRLETLLHTRLRELGQDDAARCCWNFAHYLLDDWEERYHEYPDEPGHDPEAPARMRLWAERALAISLVPDISDPASLWEGPPISPPKDSMVFAASELPLRKGENALSASYKQPVAFVHRSYRDPQFHNMRRTTEMCNFAFILRTARFWRSFGKLQIDVRLPEDMRFAECILPGAKIDSQDRPTRVTYTGRGVPEENLSVLFAGFRPIPEDAPLYPGQAAPPPVGATVPLVELPVLWQTVIAENGAWSSAQPVADDDVVLAAGGRQAAIYDRHTGEVLARLACKGEPRHLALLPDKVLMGMTGPGSLGCFDRRTGGELWHSRVGADHTAVVGDTVISGGSEPPVGAVSLADGSLRWEQDLSCQALALSNEAREGVDSGLVFLAGRGLPREALEGDNPRRAERVWLVVAVRLGSGERAWECKLAHQPHELLVGPGEVCAICTGQKHQTHLAVRLAEENGLLVGAEEVEGDLWPPQQLGPRPAGEPVLAFLHGGTIHGYALQSPLRQTWRLPQPGARPGLAAAEREAVYFGGFDGLFRADVNSGQWSWRAVMPGLGLDRWTVHEGRIYTLQFNGGVLTAYGQPDMGKQVSRVVEDAGPEAPVFGRPSDDLADVIMAAPATSLPLVPPMSIYNPANHEFPEEETGAQQDAPG